MRAVRGLAFCLAFCSATAVLLTPLNAVDDAAGKPFPELPEVIYYESFDNGQGVWNEGTRDVNPPQREKNPGLKLSPIAWEVDKTNMLWSTLKIGDAPFRLMGGMRPDDTQVFFMVWVDTPGEIGVKLKKPNRDYYQKTFISSPKQWVPIMYRLSECVTPERIKPTESDVVETLEILFHPRNRVKCTGYVDDFALLNGARGDVIPKLIAAQTARQTMQRTPEKDGFLFSLKLRDGMKSQLRANQTRRPKLRTVLVTPTAGADSEPLVQALRNSAAKVKGASALSFVSACAPGGAPLAGMEELRTLFSYSIAKTEAEMALILVSPADALTDLRAEALTNALYRAVESNCAPVVCLPAWRDAKDGQREALGKFNAVAISICNQLNVPWIDANTAARDVANLYDGPKLSSAGLNALATTAAQVLRMIDQHVFNRN